KKPASSSAVRGLTARSWTWRRKALLGAAKRPWPIEASNVERWKTSSGSLAGGGRKVSACGSASMATGVTSWGEEAWALPIGAKERKGAASKVGSGSRRRGPGGGAGGP